MFELIRQHIPNPDLYGLALTGLGAGASLLGRWLAQRLATAILARWKARCDRRALAQAAVEAARVAEAEAAARVAEDAAQADFVRRLGIALAPEVPKPVIVNTVVTYRTRQQEAVTAGYSREPCSECGQLTVKDSLGQNFTHYRKCATCGYEELTGK